MHHEVSHGAVPVRDCNIDLGSIPFHGQFQLFLQVGFVAESFHENIIDQIIHIEKCSTVWAFQKLVSPKAGCAMLITKIANGLVITDNGKTTAIPMRCAFMIIGISNK